LYGNVTILIYFQKIILSGWRGFRKNRPFTLFNFQKTNGIMKLKVKTIVSTKIEVKSNNPILHERLEDPVRPN
jgi:hypothetical protein